MEDNNQNYFKLNQGQDAIDHYYMRLKVKKFIFIYKTWNKFFLTFLTFEQGLGQSSYGLNS